MNKSNLAAAAYRRAAYSRNLENAREWTAKARSYHAEGSPRTARLFAECAREALGRCAFWRAHYRAAVQS
jgi:hypothetical protein